MSQTQLRNMIPLIKVVKGAIIDVWGDIGYLQEKYSHWAARGMEKLTNETLRPSRKKALIPISPNTLTGTLPADFRDATFVGYISDDGRKIALTSNSDLIVEGEIDEYEPDACDKCGSDKNVCEDLFVSEEINLIEIDGKLYEESVTKKLLPNGSYMEERVTPVKNLETGIITMEPSQNFITNFELKSCGCLEDCESNEENLRRYCPDTYSAYYAPCDYECQPQYMGSYKIHEETGLISVSPAYPFDQIYIEYVGFLPKLRGQYLVPAIAKETLIEWTKFKAIQNKKGVSLSEKEWQLTQYKRERANMERVNGRVDLTRIIHAAMATPRFLIMSGDSWYSCFQQNNTKMNCRKSRKRSTSCGEVQPQVVSQIIRTETTTNNIVNRKLRFVVGQPNVFDADGPVAYATPLQEGDTVFVINEEGINKDSVNVLVDGANLHEEVTDQVGYTVVYGLNGVSITFNQAAVTEQKYNITYTKTESI